MNDTPWRMHRRSQSKSRNTWKPVNAVHGLLAGNKDGRHKLCPALVVMCLHIGGTRSQLIFRPVTHRLHRRLRSASTCRLKISNRIPTRVKVYLHFEHLSVQFAPKLTPVNFPTAFSSNPFLHVDIIHEPLTSASNLKPNPALRHHARSATLVL